MRPGSSAKLTPCSTCTGPKRLTTSRNDSEIMTTPRPRKAATDPPGGWSPASGGRALGLASSGHLPHAQALLHREHRCADQPGALAERRVLDLQVARGERQRAVIHALPHRREEERADALHAA